MLTVYCTGSWQRNNCALRTWSHSRRRNYKWILWRPCCTKSWQHSTHRGRVKDVAVMITKKITLNGIQDEVVVQASCSPAALRTCWWERFICGHQGSLYKQCIHRLLWQHEANCPLKQRNWEQHDNTFYGVSCSQKHATPVSLTSPGQNCPRLLLLANLGQVPLWIAGAAFA